jgi:Bacterial Ig domain
VGPLAAAAREFGQASSALPAPPTPSSLLGGLQAAALFGVYREIESTLVDTAPTATPQQGIQLDTGEILGSLSASDTNGDNMKYRVISEPANGKVMFTEDGGLVYTPNPDFARQGGTDTFNVTIDDGRRSLFLKTANGTRLNLFGSTGKITVPVTVTVTPTLGITANFQVVNESSVPLKYRGLAENDGGDSTPPVGAIIQPGQSQAFKVNYYVFSNSHIKAVYGEPGTDTAANSFYDVYFSVAAISGDKNSGCTARRGACEELADEGRGLEDSPGTQITVAATDTAKQASILGLCGGPASCSFAPTSQAQLYTPKRHITTILNTSGASIVDSQTYTDTFTESDSVSATAKLSGSIAKIVNAEISATYGHTWTKTRVESSTRTVTVPARTSVVVSVEQPIYRVTGTFTVSMGNTTWTLPGVYFDSPDPTRGPIWYYEEPVPALEPTDAGTSTSEA